MTSESYADEWYEEEIGYHIMISDNQYIKDYILVSR